MRFLVSSLALAIPLLVDSKDVNQIQPRIVGGQQSLPGEHPYFVEWDGCGGSLIHPDLVLTAAHCIDGLSADTVLVGAFESGTATDGAVFRDIETILAHPNWDSWTYENDFGVLKLVEPVYTLPTLPVNYDPDTPLDGDVLTVIGLGDLEDGGSSPDFLHEVDVEYISNEKCSEAYGEEYFEDVMFCAGIDGGGKDSCQGDSGGPIMDQNGTQVGVVSWGYGCALEGYPGFYSRTSAVAEWIQNQICFLSSYPPDDCGETESPTGTPTEFPTAATTAPIVQVRLTVLLDGYPEETTVKIFELPSMELLLSYENLTDAYAHIVEEFSVPSGDILLYMHDTYGDGMAGTVLLESIYDEGSNLIWYDSGNFFSEYLFETVTVPAYYSNVTDEAPTAFPTESPTMAPGSCDPYTANGTCVHFFFVLDEFPSETSVYVLDKETNDVVWENENFYNLGTYDAYVDLAPGDYTFQATDVYADGICCDYGEGYFEVYAMTVVEGTEELLEHLLLHVDGDFGASTSADFTVP